MKLTLVFLLLIGAVFQNTQSAEIIDTDIITPSIPTSSIINALYWKHWIDSMLDKANDGVSWVNGQLAELRNNLNPISPEVQSETTITETLITKTEEIITLDDD